MLIRRESLVNDHLLLWGLVPGVGIDSRSTVGARIRPLIDLLPTFRVTRAIWLTPHGKCLKTAQE